MKIELSDFKPLQVCGLDEYGDTLTMSAVHGWSSFTEPKQGCETLSSFSIGTEEGLKEDEAGKYSFKNASWCDWLVIRNLSMGI